VEVFPWQLINRNRDYEKQKSHYPARFKDAPGRRRFVSGSVADQHLCRRHQRPKYESGREGARNKAAAKLTDDQRILHVLNRLGFGARPGDLERVKAVGVDNYINQQLSPEKIDDSTSEAKLQNLGTLRMSTAELYEKYPQPGQLLRQLQQRGALPADLAQARDNRVKGGANAAPGATAQKSGATSSTQGPGEMQGPEMAKPNDTAKTNAPANNDANPQTIRSIAGL